MPPSAFGPIINLKGVGKRYPHYRSRLDHLWHALLGKHPATASDFIALNGVNFSMNRGECVGVVGRNGAGKSTLLQIITGVLTPSNGDVSISGRVGALLELGAGFNPDFTGRENIQLTAALIGIPLSDLDQVIEQIISFADIGNHIDDPVRTYSSGMYVRVAFSVQIHLLPDILIIDEALAVGDAAFQSKCFRRLKQLRESGTSILFVSHDVQTVRTLCERAIWLENGEVQMDGSASDVTAAYMRALFSEENNKSPSPPPVDSLTNTHLAQTTGNDCQHAELAREGLIRWGSGEIRIVDVVLSSNSQIGPGILEHGGDVNLRITALVESKPNATCIPSLAFSIKHRKGLDIIVDTTRCHGILFPLPDKGKRIQAEFSFPNILAPDDYELIVAVENGDTEPPNYIDFIEGALYFKVVSSKRIYSLTKPAVEITTRIE